MAGQDFDIAVIGGGPAGATYAALVKKYAPELKVGLFEREIFPREHVGESLLPVACRVLNELGCWEEIERLKFPVKIGATYRWGPTDELWDFDFLEGAEYQNAPRPATYVGQRRSTAFQVERSKFDQVLLNRARALGATVCEGRKVSAVDAESGSVLGLHLENGDKVHAALYVDASGHSGAIRRAIGVEYLEPSKLRNVAAWSYWDNASWATTIGADATRVLVLSLGYGWIWFIPVSECRASVGLVVPVEHLKASGKSLNELYSSALLEEPKILELLNSATMSGSIQTTKDWSFVADITAKENWILVGESAGFADPILAAGVSMAMVGASDAAALSIAWLDGSMSREWLMGEYDRNQQRRIRSHIHFADFWYTANSRFTDLVEYTSQIAREAGMSLDGKSAWRWLGTGGFLEPLGAGIAGYGLAATGWISQNFSDVATPWNISSFNKFHLNLNGAVPGRFAIFREGKVLQVDGYTRNKRTLYIAGMAAFLVDTLSVTEDLEKIVYRIKSVWCARPGIGSAGFENCLHVLEALLNDDWIAGSIDPTQPLLKFEGLSNTKLLHKSAESF